MKLLTLTRKTPIFLMIALAAMTFSCDKAEDILLSDSEKLMKDIKGSYNLVSVRHEDFYSVNGGFSYILDVDTTYTATGLLDISNINKAEYTGTLTIKYSTFDETHAINGNASDVGDFDKLWIITDNSEDIQCLVLFNPPASYLEGWLDERDNNHLLLRISETSVDYSGQKNRYFRFEKMK